MAGRATSTRRADDATGKFAGDSRVFDDNVINARDFEERKERDFAARMHAHEVNGMTMLYPQHLEAAHQITNYIHAFASTLTTMFDADRAGGYSGKEMQPAVIKEAIDGLAWMAALADFHISESERNQ